MRNTIRERAENLLTELYRNIPNGERSLSEVSLRDYYDSWLLRGDHPYWYFEIGRILDPGQKDCNLPHYQYFRAFALNNFRERRCALYACRKCEKAVTLLHYYHFSQMAREAGEKPVRFQVSEEYIRLMAQTQWKMQDYVTRMGLSVECNPSSNTLIGTFDEYAFHPVFQFNAPSPRHESHGNGAMQLHVSLNTDDQGIFDTNLVQEYSLIAAALYEQHDDAGMAKYQEREIEEYIRSLQRMGCEQSFLDKRPYSQKNSGLGD